MYKKTLLLLFSLLVPQCCVATKEKAKNLRLPTECLLEYKTIVDKYGDEKGHCLRLQLIVNCFSKRKSESGLVLDDMRYLFTQEAIFVNKLGECDIDYEDLKEISEKTDVAKKHRYLDSVDDDHWDECALNVHKACIKKYLSLMSRDGKVCNGADAWVHCYPKEAKRTGCEARILDHFTKMLQVVGESVVKAIRRFMGIECGKIEL